MSQTFGNQTSKVNFERHQRGENCLLGVVFECNGLEGDNCNDEVHDNDEGGDDNDFFNAGE